MSNRLWCEQLLCLTLLAVDATHAATQNQSVPVTVTQATSQILEVAAEVRGDLESPATPLVAAETGGRIIEIQVEEGNAVKEGQVLALLDREMLEITLERAEAELSRVAALINNQQVTVRRFQDLVQQKSSAQSELDRVQTELQTLLAQRAGASAQIKEIRYQLAKTAIISPVEGVVQRRKVSVGDFVRQGDGLFQIVMVKRLRARLYFPETLVTQVRAGLTVQLQRTGSAESPVLATLSRLLPMLDPANRGLEGLVEFSNASGWQPGASIQARVILETRKQAVFVPNLSLVHRPAGEVVYRVVNQQAVAQVVSVGLRKGEQVEIRSGLRAGETVVVDGAGFLTDGVRLNIRNQTP